MRVVAVGVVAVVPQLNGGCTRHGTFEVRTGSLGAVVDVVAVGRQQPAVPRFASSPGEKYALWRLVGSRTDWPKSDLVVEREIARR